MSDFILLAADGLHEFEYNPDRRKEHIVLKRLDGTRDIVRKDNREPVATGFESERDAEAWFYDDKGLVDLSWRMLRSGVSVAPGLTLQELADVIDRDQFLSLLAPYLFPYLGAVGLEEDGLAELRVGMSGEVVNNKLFLSPTGVSLKGNPVVKLTDEMFLYCNGTRYRGEISWSVMDLLLALFGELPENRSTVTLRKDGIFDDEDGHQVEVLESLGCFCHLGSGLTLRDVFAIVEKDELATLFFKAYSWCWAIEEFHDAAKREIHNPDGILVRSEVYASMDMVIRKHKDDAKPFDFSVGHDFHAVGHVEPEQRAEHPDWYEGREFENYGISMTPVEEYAWLPIEMNNTVELKEYRLDLHQEVTSVSFDRGITLLDFLDAIYMEVSFHGGPAQAQEFRDELRGRVEEIKSGMAKTVPWEEVRDEMAERAKENCTVQEEVPESPGTFRTVDELLDELKKDELTEEEVPGSPGTFRIAEDVFKEDAPTEEKQDGQQDSGDAQA